MKSGPDALEKFGWRRMGGEWVGGEEGVRNAL